MLKVDLFSITERGLVTIFSLIMLINISSCTKEGIEGSENNLQKPTEVEAVFRTTIENNKEKVSSTTRASGTMWEEGDAIGIFALNQVEAPAAPTIYDDKKNVKYINDTPGITANFSAAVDEIKFPTSKEMLDFIAYYPYSSTRISEVTGEDLNINVSNQSPQSEIDVLYASATGYNSDNPEVDLTFQHKLSQLTFVVTAEEEIVLEEAEITIHNCVTQGSINLMDGTITPDTDTITRDTITPVSTFNSTENSITATAIMLPNWDLSETEVYIHTSNGNVYLWQPAEYQLQSNTNRTYRLNLMHNTVEMKVIGSTISDWQVDPYDETEDIVPVDTDVPFEKIGNGTENSPYTVSQFLTKKDETEVWVKGYIMGWAVAGTPVELKNNSPSEYYAKDNIVLAENLSETEFSKMTPIKFIKDSDIQNQYNLFDHFNLIGSEVKVRCNRGKPFGVAGGTDIIGFEIIE